MAHLKNAQNPEQNFKQSLSKKYELMHYQEVEEESNGAYNPQNTFECQREREI